MRPGLPASPGARNHRRRPSASLVVAALAVAGLAACSGGSSDDAAGQATSTSRLSTTSAPGGPTTTSGATTTTGPAATTTTVAASRYRSFGAPVTVTTGYLVGSSPDGSALYVERIDDRYAEPGCEGQPEPVMFRVPVTGGEGELILVGGQPVRGNLVRGPGGKVAVVDLCEGFFSALYVGTESSDGRLRDLRPVPVSVQGSLGGFNWSPDGSRLIAGRSDFVGQSGTVVAIDVATGAITELLKVDASPFVTEAALLTSGDYAVAGGGQASLRRADGVILSSVPGYGFALAPDARRVATYGPSLLLLTPGQAGPVPLVSPTRGEVVGANFSPDGTAVVYAVGAEAGDSVGVVTLADGRTVEVPGAGAGHVLQPLFIGNGGAVVFNVIGDGQAGGPADPAVVLVAATG